MIKGYNKSDLVESIGWLLNAQNSIDIRTRPCVFLSHKKEDKPYCREIAKYLSNAGIDYYLDEEDKYLQQAVNDDDPNEITKRINNGIQESSHMLVVVSEKTYKSQWVPFEVGYGQAAIIDKSEPKDEKIRLSILTIKDISEKELPTFMQVGNIIRGTKSLNDYIVKISNTIEKSMINEARIFSHSQSSHPLDNILNWKL